MLRTLPKMLSTHFRTTIFKRNSASCVVVQVCKMCNIRRRDKHAAGIPVRLHSLVVEGSGAKGMGRALRLDIVGGDKYTIKRKWMFNCNGLVYREGGTKTLSKVDIFVTHKSWENLSLFLGQYFTDTSEEDGESTATFYGPSGLVDWLLHRKPPKMKNLLMKEKTYKDTLSCTVPGMNVEFVPFFGPMRNLGSKGYFFKQLDMPLKKEQDVAVAYICRPPDVKNNDLSAEKLARLNFPIRECSHLIKELQNDKEVTLPDGRLIKPEDVLHESPGRCIFIVLECPSLEFVDSLVEQKAFRTFQDQEETANFIVHLTDEHIIQDPKYQLWIKSFGDNTQHLILNDHNEDLGRIARLHLIRHYIHPRLFPLLHDMKEPKDCTKMPVDGKIVRATTGMCYNFKDQKFSRDNCQGHFDRSVIPEEFQTVECQQAMQEFETKLKSLSLTDQQYPEICFLGTGAYRYSINRNEPGILIHNSSDTCMLFDCGLGSFEALELMYGKETDEVLRKLKFIFISHCHPDHYKGLIKMIKAYNKAWAKGNSYSEKKPNLHILLPRTLKLMMRYYCAHIENIFDNVRFLHTKNSWQAINRVSSMLNPQVSSMLNSQIKFVPVPHFKDSHGIVVTHNDGWKLVYSGDCRPSKALVQEGMNCDVLIHEATFSAYLRVFGQRYEHHCSLDETLQVASDMKAKYTLLTHFSGPLPNVPHVHYISDDLNVGPALDYMRIPFSHLPIIPLLNPVLRAAFPLDEEKALDEEETDYSLREMHEKFTRQIGEMDIYDRTDHEQLHRHFMEYLKTHQS